MIEKFFLTKSIWNTNMLNLQKSFWQYKIFPRKGKGEHFFWSVIYWSNLQLNQIKKFFSVTANREAPPFSKSKILRKFFSTMSQISISQHWKHLASELHRHRTYAQGLKQFHLHHISLSPWLSTVLRLLACFLLSSLNVRLEV